MEIKKYQQKINNILDNFIKDDIDNDKIREMISWALKGGKRLRSMIVLDISNSLCKKHKRDIELNNLAISCELIHTISLIIDDLPCMDNDNFRRDIETIHYKYGVNNAIVLSTFISSKITELLYSNIKKLENHFQEDYINKLRDILIKNYLENYNTAILGQYVDIYPLKKSKEDNIRFTGNIKDNYLRKIIIDKTAPFFEIAFIGSYLLSGGNIDKYNEVKKISQIFGIIFQISDDFEDQKQDLEKGCYSLIQNYVIIIGKEKALKDFYKLTNLFILYMKKMDLYSDLFENIIKYLINRVEKYK